VGSPSYRTEDLPQLSLFDLTPPLQNNNQSTVSLANTLSTQHNNIAMAYSRTAQLATFLALTSSAFAFAPSHHYSAHRRNTATELSASNNQDDGWKKVAGGAASFVTGLGFLAQVSFADPNSIATVDQTQMASVSSSNVLLSGGAPSFGGGGSFETLDFSLPSYDQATSSSTLSSPKKDVSDLFGSKSSSDDDAAAKEAAKKQAEAEKKQAAEEARAAKEAEKEAKAKAEADAKAEKEAKAKADEDAKAAKEAEKEARKVRRIPLPE
jgi:chemotaxis protein histidine kinase CheA